MIQKDFVSIDGKPIVRVAFNVPKGRTRTIHLVGDFNDWSASLHPMRRDPTMGWTLTLELELGRAYQFRYLRDGGEWMYDSQADGYVYNADGVHNFIVVTDPSFQRYSGEAKKDA